MQQHRWTVRHWAVFLAAALGFLAARATSAQEGPIVLPPEVNPPGLAPPVALPFVSPPSADPSSTIQELLRRGYQLESERRWGDALLHYEEALRTFPAHPNLERRYEYTRLHYDLVRRYMDRSFLRTTEALSLQEALALYNDVLGKIQAHYVDTFSWKDLVERGATNLEVALTEPVFVSRYLVGVDSGQLAAFRQSLRELMARQQVPTRTAAWEAVREVADLGFRQLGLSPTVVTLECLCGVTNTLDPYSAFLSPTQLEEIYSQIEGNFVGLGVELRAEGGALRIVRVVPNSPAQQGGLRAGDRILAVNGQTTAPLTTEQAGDLLQGPEGSVVELTVQTPGQPSRQLTLRRRRVEVPSIEEARLVDPEAGVAYVKLGCFQKTTARDLEAILWDLYRQGMRSLVVDVRGNPGGLLSTAVEVADKFLDQGVIVSTRGRSPQEDFTYTAHTPGTWRMPLVVLVDQESASAAEIFAGAIRDHRRGTLVGQRTYGKGSVQGIFPLNYGGTGVRLTTSRFYSPNGQSLNRVGVDPDIVVHRSARIALTENTSSGGAVHIALPGPTPATDEDPALAAALQTARQSIGRR